MQAKTLTTQVNLTLQRTIAGVIFFTALTALTARITVEIGPVPITLQSLAVLLSGLVLGARGGAAAQLAYVTLIATGLPLDARALGPAAFVGPTAGYLVGFIPMAFVTGWLAERFVAQKWWGNFLAAMAGTITLFVIGATWLAMLTSWEVAWTAGVAPFIIGAVAKAVIATGIGESGKYWLNRF